MNLTELELQIVHYNAQYREGRPEISDEQYDQLVDRLKQEQPESTLLKKGVIETPKESRKVKLPFPMMSLEKEKTFEGVVMWAKSFYEPNPVLIITPKFDGITLLTLPTRKYLTRGDGEIGQDCTEHCTDLNKSLRSSIPLKGELIIRNLTWKEHDIFRQYKHPRNVVAGWINGDYDPSTPYYLMDCLTYDVPGGTGSNKKEMLDYLNENHNPIQVPYLEVHLQNLTDELIHSVFQAWKIAFPIDGVVIEMNDQKYRGLTHTNGNPVNAIAYKNPLFTEVAQTTIKGIEYSVSRYGVVTPTVLIDPVFISGAEISRVNGVNLGYLTEWGLFKGIKVEIMRSGEVIPKIIKVEGVKIPFIDEYQKASQYQRDYKSAVEERGMEGSRDIEEFFDNLVCPFCESELIWDQNYVQMVCTNQFCPEILFQKVYEFFRILEVEEFSEKTFRTLYENGFQTVQLILSITVEELLTVPGFADKSAKSFVQAMNRLKKEGAPIARYMHASGHFPNLGEKTLQLILDNWPAGTFLEKEKLIEINGIGERTADVFIEGYKGFIYDFKETEDWFCKVVYRETPKKEKKEGIFSGNIFCFTGCRPNPELREKLENAGAEITESFNSKVTHLVTKDRNSTSSKTEKAKKSGVIIVPLEDLM